MRIALFWGKKVQCFWSEKKKPPRKLRFRKRNIWEMSHLLLPRVKHIVHFYRHP